MCSFSIIFVIDNIENESPYSNLSIKLKIELPGLPYADLIEKRERAVFLLNNPSAIVKAPSVYMQGSKNYLVAGKEKKPYEVNISDNGVVKCNCKGFDFANICKHSAAVAEKEKMLKDLVAKAKTTSIAKLQKVKGGDGGKGHANRRKMDYSNIAVGLSNDSNPSNPNSPFTEIWHNNEPIYVCTTKEIPLGKVCGYCSKDFPRIGAISIVPYDIALNHGERWMYFNKNRESASDPAYLPSPGNKMTIKYYCVSKICVFKRFPYFSADFLCAA